MSHWLPGQLAKFSCHQGGQQQWGALLVVWPWGTTAMSCHHSSNEPETGAKAPWAHFAIFRRGGVNPRVLCVAGPVGETLGTDDRVSISVHTLNPRLKQTGSGVLSI